MKVLTKLSACMLLMFITLSACSNSADDSQKEKSDSIQADAAADSMLQDALKSDTTTQDEIRVDTTKK